MTMSRPHQLVSLLLLSASLRTPQLLGQTNPSSPAPQQYAKLGDVTLENGAVIHDCKLGYRTLGKLNASHSNAILFPSWFSGSSLEAMGQVGQKGLFDPSPYFIVFIDAIGNGISCSPSNSTSQHGTSFPNFTIRDMVASEHKFATEVLGLQHVRAVMGVSMGGMQTFQWVVSYPSFMDVAIPIVGTPRMSSYDMLLWRSEEEAIVRDPAYDNGNYQSNPLLPVMQLIHSMNVTTPQFRAEHTSSAEFAAFFAATEASPTGVFDANDWRWQIHAMLAQDIAPGGSLDQAARTIRAKMLIINGRQDHMVNPLASIAFAPLVRAPIIVLEGDCGHLSPGCEVDSIRPKIEALLAH